MMTDSKAIKEDLPKAAEANTTVKAPHNITTIKGITIKVVTKAFKASTTIKEPPKAKTEEESIFTREGEMFSTIL